MFTTIRRNWLKEDRKQFIKFENYDVNIKRNTLVEIYYIYCGRFGTWDT